MPKKIADASVAVPWTANDHKLTRVLLSELEKPQNCQKFKDWICREEVCKVFRSVVCPRLAATVLPEHYAADPNHAGLSVYGKMRYLKKLYHDRLSGIRQSFPGHNAGETDNVESEWVLGIPADGPHDETPEEVRKAWSKAQAKFPVFGQMYRLLYTALNFVDPSLASTSTSQPTRHQPKRHSIKRNRLTNDSFSESEDDILRQTESNYRSIDHHLAGPSSNVEVYADRGSGKIVSERTIRHHPYPPVHARAQNKSKIQRRQSSEELDFEDQLVSEQDYIESSAESSSGSSSRGRSKDKELREREAKCRELKLAISKGDLLKELYDRGIYTKEDLIRRLDSGLQR